MQQCPVNSFTRATRVLLANGAKRAISKIRAGQKVLASDPYTGVSGARRVAKVIVHRGVHAMAAITLAGGVVIHATAHHPVWDATAATFTYAADLHPGDRLREPTGATAEIARVRRYTADLTAYNLDVTGIHTYYVQAGRTAILVHNSCGDNPDVLFGQRRISPNFSAGRAFRGRSIYAVAQDLRNGILDPKGVRVNAFWHEGQLVAENNRSLAALSLAGLRPTNVNILDSVTQDVEDRLSDPVLLDRLPSRMTAVTPVRKT